MDRHARQYRPVERWEVGGGAKVETLAPLPFPCAAIPFPAAPASPSNPINPATPPAAALAEEAGRTK